MKKPKTKSQGSPVCLGLQETIVEMQEWYELVSATVYLSSYVQSRASVESLLERPADTAVCSPWVPKGQIPKSYLTLILTWKMRLVLNLWFSGTNSTASLPHSSSQGSKLRVGSDLLMRLCFKANSWVLSACRSSVEAAVTNRAEVLSLTGAWH